MRRVEVWDYRTDESPPEAVGTVGDLIAALNKIKDPTRRIALAGCDCRGFWDGTLSFDEDGDITLLRRDGPGREDSVCEPDAPYAPRDDF